MNGKRILQVVLGILGLLFAAAVLALMQFNNPAKAMDQMMAAVYATLGVFLLLAIRNPSAHRSLIAFAAWSSFAHGGVMAIQAFSNVIPRRDLLVAVLPLFVIGVVLIVLAPPNEEATAANRTVKAEPLGSMPSQPARS
jgi:uncharacterized membrane protein YeaQ/YmgE (transglycosylase-associated protein family)